MNGMPTRRNILMVAFHFPPIQGSSGVHRTVSFCRKLIERGWQPVVLTVPSFALPGSRPENIRFIPPTTRIIRAFALDASRHLAIRGRYFGWLSIPDKWMVWVPFAVISAIWEIILRRSEVIYSTYPIASAHLVGYLLRKITRLPWVADFRDPMAQDGYPADPIRWKAFKWIEEQVVRNADRIIFSTPGAKRDYVARYGELVDRKGFVIENGYDNELLSKRSLTLSAKNHSKAIQVFTCRNSLPSERDPSAFSRGAQSNAKIGCIENRSSRNIVTRNGTR